MAFVRVDSVVTRRTEASLLSWVGALSNHLEVGVLVLGPDQSLDFASAKACDQLGCASEEELEQQWTRISSALEPVLNEDGGPASEALVTMVADGVERRLHCKHYPLNEEAYVGWLLLIQDAARAESLETSLRLATRYRSLDSLYLSTAHDVKGTLHAIVLNLELLNRSIDDPAERRKRLQQRSLRVLKTEIGHLERSIAAMLDFGTSRSGQRERFDLVKLMRTLVELVRTRVDRQKVTLEVNLPEAEVHVAGYRDRLQQAFLNLLMNALEAMPDGGTIGITLEANDERASTTICDNGPGIPEALEERIWQLHFTTKERGTGIGLPVTQSIVRAHRGRIALVRKAKGQGACFTVDLPTARVKETEF